MLKILHSLFLFSISTQIALAQQVPQEYVFPYEIRNYRHADGTVESVTRKGFDKRSKAGGFVEYQVLKRDGQCCEWITIDPRHASTGTVSERITQYRNSGRLNELMTLEKYRDSNVYEQISNGLSESGGELHTVTTRDGTYQYRGNATEDSRSMTFTDINGDTRTVQKSDIVGSYARSGNTNRERRETPPPPPRDLTRENDQVCDPWEAIARLPINQSFLMGLLRPVSRALYTCTSTERQSLDCDWGTIGCQIGMASSDNSDPQSRVCDSDGTPKLPPVCAQQINEIFSDREGFHILTLLKRKRNPSHITWSFALDWEAGNSGRNLNQALSQASEYDLDHIVNILAEKLFNNLFEAGKENFVDNSIADDGNIGEWNCPECSKKINFACKAISTYMEGHDSDVNAIILSAQSPLVAKSKMKEPTHRQALARAWGEVFSRQPILTTTAAPLSAPSASEATSETVTAQIVQTIEARSEQAETSSSTVPLPPPQPQAPREEVNQYTISSSVGPSSPEFSKEKSRVISIIHVYEEETTRRLREIANVPTVQGLVGREVSFNARFNNQNIVISGTFQRFEVSPPTQNDRAGKLYVVIVGNDGNERKLALINPGRFDIPVLSIVDSRVLPPSASEMPALESDILRQLVQPSQDQASSLRQRRRGLALLSARSGQQEFISRGDNAGRLIDALDRIVVNDNRIQRRQPNSQEITKVLEVSYPSRFMHEGRVRTVVVQELTRSDGKLQITVRENGGERRQLSDSEVVSLLANGQTVINQSPPDFLLALEQLILQSFANNPNGSEQDFKRYDDEIRNARDSVNNDVSARQFRPRADVVEQFVNRSLRNVQMDYDRNRINRNGDLILEVGKHTTFHSREGRVLRTVRYKITRIIREGSLQVEVEDPESSGRTRILSQFETIQLLHNGYLSEF